MKPIKPDKRARHFELGLQAIASMPKSTPSSVLREKAEHYLATAPPEYTHIDVSEIRWRFAGSRPVSELADDLMIQSGFELPK